MAHQTVELTIPFESLAEAVAKLSLEDKKELLELLDRQIAEAEEEMWEQDPKTRAEIEEARAAYQAGNYVTIDEYTTEQAEKGK